MTKEQIVLGMMEVTNNNIRQMASQQNMDLVELEKYIETQRDSMAFYYGLVYDWMDSKGLLAK